MDGATLQAKIYAGYAKSAQRVGLNYDLYRAMSASSPTAAGNKLTTLPVAMNQDPGFTFQRPNKYGNPTWLAMLDGTQTEVGDYLIGPQGTLFIAAMQQSLPVLLVECNRTLNVKRPQQQSGVGAVGYGGDTAANETPLMTGWPGSVLQGTKGEKNEVALAGDVRSPWWVILLPAYAGVTLRSSDIITDDLNRRYVISSAELSDLGWRITAMQAQT